MPRPDGPGRTRPVLGQAGEQRVFGERAHRAGAVDHRARRVRLVAVVEGDVDAGGLGRRRTAATVPGGGPAGPEPRPRRGGGRGDRRHPVPVHVPGAGVLGEEASLVVLRQPPPQLGGDGTEPVDRGSPVAGLATVLSTWACTAARSSSRSCVRVMPGGGGTGGVVGSTCGLRHGVVPRDRVEVRSGPVGARSRRRPSSGRCRPGAGRRRAARRVHGSATRRPDVGEPGRRPVGAGPGAGGEHDGAGAIVPRRPTRGATTNRSPRRSTPATLA